MAPVFGSTVGARARGVRVEADVASPAEVDAKVGAGVAPEVGVEEEDDEQPQFTLNCSVEDGVYTPLPVKSPEVVCLEKSPVESQGGRQTLFQ